jgi:hypothetical protein
MLPPSLLPPTTRRSTRLRALTGVVATFSTADARRLVRAVLGDVVERQEAIEAHNGEVRQQVVTDEKGRELLCLSMGTFTATSMQPRSNAAHWGLHTVHAGHIGDASRRALHAASRGNHATHRGLHATSRGIHTQARSGLGRKLMKSGRPRAFTAAQRHRGGTSHHQRRGRRGTTPQHLAVGAGGDLLLLVVGVIRPSPGGRGGGGRRRRRGR